MKRLFDITASLFGLIILFPFLLIVSIVIIIDSKGPVFYKQIRLGLNRKEFGLMKLRTMRTDSDSKGLLTVGARDSRITSSGYFLRKYKLDEIPQLLNVFIGDMSIVGPRPEVKKYVDMYNDSQLKVLDVRPGLTDYASIEYIDENTLLGNSDNPEELYINEIMPAKLNLNLKYIENKGFLTDISIIFKTIFKIIS